MKLQLIVSAALALFSTVPGAVVSASAPLESVDFDSADLAEFDEAADSNNVFAALAYDTINGRGRGLSCDVGPNTCERGWRQGVCVWRNGRCRNRNNGGGGNRRCDSNFANQSRNHCENRTRGRSCTWMRRRNGRSFCTFSSVGGGNRRCDSNFANQSRNHCENRTRGRSCTWVRRRNGRSFCTFSSGGGGRINCGGIRTRGSCNSKDLCRWTGSSQNGQCRHIRYYDESADFSSAEEDYDFEESAEYDME